MDGKIGSANIVTIFKDKYMNILNSVGYKTEDINLLKSDVDDLINNETAMNNMKLEHIVNAINNLKPGKNEESGMCTNHLKYGPDRLFVHLTLLYNSMVNHGTSSIELVEGIMLPLIKDKRNSHQKSDNYRALTLGTILSKMFETVILQNNSHIFHSSEQQFGFKADSSTTVCSFVLNETISYYNANDSAVFALMLDASKAFDRVAYVKLFRKLIKRGLNPYIVRFLLNMYTQQSIRVKWNGAYSESFNVSNGVRQGGIISPLLFIMYIDELICKLKLMGIGCHIGRYFCGLLGFADDIMLLCPTLDGLRKMIRVCEDYANDHSILFNGSKSKLLIFGEYRNQVHIVVNGESVPTCNEAVYLGIPINTKYEKKFEFVDIGSAKFNRQFNFFNAIYKSCYTTVKQNLFMQHCGSLYGSQLWPLWHNKINIFYAQWRKALRVIWSLPYRSHCKLLPLISDTLPIEVIMFHRVFNFYTKAINSSNRLVSYIAKNCKYIHSSVMNNNIKYMLYKCNLHFEDLLNLSESQFKKICLDNWSNSLNDNDFQVANTIKDVIHMREGYYLKFFCDEDSKYLIHYLSTQ